MALVDIQQKWSGVNAEVSQATGIALGVAMETQAASKGYTVLFDATATPLDAANAIGIPAIGAGFDGSTYAYLTANRKRATPIGPFLFEVVVEYAGEASPTLRPYERSWQDATSVEQVSADADDDLIVNAVGDPVILEREFSDPVYVVTRNEAAEPLATIQTYSETVNDDSFQGYAAGLCKMLPIVTSREVAGTTYFWRVTYRIQCRASGWAFRYPNKGPRYRPTAGAAPAAVADLGRTEALLAANGTLLADGGTPVFLTADLYPATTFATLGLV
ncbi:MAG TPA: hypothetical protein VFH53_04555 [Phycisphaerae bacterium]|nr:hypothetical protein [Phycisphaerae bacterium]